MLFFAHLSAGTLELAEEPTHKTWASNAIRFINSKLSLCSVR